MEVYLRYLDFNKFYVGYEVIAYKNLSFTSIPDGYKKILVSPIEIIRDYGNEISILKMY